MSWPRSIVDTYMYWLVGAAKARAQHWHFGCPAVPPKKIDPSHRHFFPPPPAPPDHQPGRQRRRLACNSCTTSVAIQCPFRRRASLLPDSAPHVARNLPRLRHRSCTCCSTHTHTHRCLSPPRHLAGRRSTRMRLLVVAGRARTSPTACVRNPAQRACNAMRRA